jgi:hypothetical protein
VLWRPSWKVGGVLLEGGGVGRVLRGRGLGVKGAVGVGVDVGRGLWVE